MNSLFVFINYFSAPLSNFKNYMILNTTSFFLIRLYVHCLYGYVVVVVDLPRIDFTSSYTHSKAINLAICTVTRSSFVRKAAL